MSHSTRPNNGFHYLFVAGIGVVVIAIFWWLAYYSQANGLFGSLQEKAFCLIGYNSGCAELRSEMTGSLPLYMPWLFWLGVIEAVIGVFLTKKSEPVTGVHA